MEAFILKLTHIASFYSWWHNPNSLFSPNEDTQSILGETKMSSRLIKIPVFGLFLDRTNRQFSIVKTLMPVTQNFDEDVRKIDVDALRGANAEFSTVHSSVAGELIATTLKPCPEPEFGELIVTLLKNAGACPLAFHEIYPKFSLHVISCDLCRGKVSALAKLDMPPAPVTPIFTEPQESLSVTQPLQ